MKDIIKDKLVLGVGTIIGLTIVDVINEDGFDFKQFLIRTMVIIVFYVIFAFVESRRKRK